MIKEAMQGHISVYRNDNKQVLMQDHNVIVYGITHLFSRLFARYGTIEGEVIAPVWGLALGGGDPSWGDDSPEDPATFELVDQQHLRKPISRVQFVRREGDFFVPSDAITTFVSFDTVIESVRDGLILPDGSVKELREMGLIGGGDKALGTNMRTAEFWSPTTNHTDTVTLLNYKRTRLVFPPGVAYTISWVLEY